MWETLQAIVIGLLAPGGIWLGWYLQRRDKRSESDREKKALLRQKAEQIYEEIEAVRKRNDAALMGAIEYQFRPNTELPELTPALGRLRALVNMYFPDGTRLIADYDIAVHKPIKAFGDAIADIESNQEMPVNERLQAMKEARTKCVKEASELLIKLLGELTFFMNDEVGTLLK
jgi:hypothetical protein